MRRVDLRSFKDFGGLIQYFNTYFSMGSRPFMPFQNVEDCKIWLELLYDLLVQNKLLIYEYTYVYNHRLAVGATGQVPLWDRLRRHFTSGGVSIDELRMNVLQMVTASDEYFDAAKCDVEIVRSNALLFKDKRTLVLMGRVDFFKLINCLMTYQKKAEHILFFPYPANKSKGLLAVEKFFYIKLTQEGCDDYNKLLLAQKQQAVNIIDAIRNK